MHGNKKRGGDPIIGQRIRELRKSKDVTQRELADYLGVTPKTISFYEKGARSPNHELLVKISNFFHEPIDYLLGQDVPRGDYMRLALEAQQAQLSSEDVELVLSVIKRLKKTD
jgi:transcriptional regulator with XRE-family HTH domain